MKVLLNIGRQYTIWSEEAKTMFDSEFSDYLSNGYGYANKCIGLKSNHFCLFHFYSGICHEFTYELLQNIGIYTKSSVYLPYYFYCVSIEDLKQNRN